jgi:two-component system, NarL family, sensor kinase
MEVQTDIDIFIFLMVLAFICLGFLMLNIFKTHKSNLLRLEKERQFAIFKTASEAEEKQKEKIGHNLHDTISPPLSAVERSIGQNIADYGTENFDIKRLEKDHKILGKAVSDLRNVSHDLVPKTLQQLGLIEALREYVGQINGTGGREAIFENLSKFKDQLPLPEENITSIYRICLELLNNLVKHTNFSYLTLMVKSDEKNIDIVLMHNGKGITNEEINKLAEHSSGLGLKSIKSRVLMIEALLDYSIQPDFAYITLKVPITR